MFFYKTGEAVRAGDHIRFHLEPGTIEFVAGPEERQDPDKGWYVQQFGGGVMILENHLGRTFLPTSTFDKRESNWEDLQFVSRAGKS